MLYSPCCIFVSHFPYDDDGLLVRTSAVPSAVVVLRNCEVVDPDVLETAHGTRSETMAILVKELQGVTKRLRAFP